jgi:outer membrane protein
LKKILLIISFFMASFTIHAEIKIGIVDVNKILKEAPQTIAANKKLEKELKPRTEKLKTKVKSLQDDEKKYQKDALTLSDIEREKTEKNLQQRRIDIQRDERELREDMDLRRREEIGDLQEKINETIDTIAANEEFDLILYNGIAFASAKVDLTDQIIKSLGGGKKAASKEDAPKEKEVSEKPKKDAAE